MASSSRNTEFPSFLLSFGLVWEHLPVSNHQSLKASRVNEAFCGDVRSSFCRSEKLPSRVLLGCRPDVCAFRETCWIINDIKKGLSVMHWQAQAT